VSSARLSISVLTACTGVKATSSPGQLTQADFAEGAHRIQEAHRRLLKSLVPAEQFYRGQQHLRLMRGVETARSLGHHISVSIVSAGYGLLAGERLVAPYSCTFQGMTAEVRREWAEHLELAEPVARLLAKPSDLSVVLLGDDYFQACAPNGLPAVNAPTVVVCGARTALRIAPGPNVHPLVLRESDTRRFGCGLVGLKGEIAGRLLRWLSADPTCLEQVGSASLLDELASVTATAAITAHA
jgi:hypothetical protein